MLIFLKARCHSRGEQPDGPLSPHGCLLAASYFLQPILVRVLVIHPEEVFGQKLHRFLQQVHYLVDCAATHAAAVERLARHEYDFVLLAAELPDGDGLALLRAAVLDPLQPASFIILTAPAAVGVRLKAFDLGADDCLPNTVLLSELERRMQAIARRRFRLKDPKFQFGDGFVMHPGRPYPEP